MVGLSVVLRGSLEEHIAYTFFIYDLNQDGSINKDEMFCILRNALRPPSNDCGLQDHTTYCRHKECAYREKGVAMAVP